MKVLFITGAYPTECVAKLAQQSKVPLQNASNVFQWAMIDGFVMNNCELTVACCPFLPSFPIRYKQIYTPKGKMKYAGKIIGDYLQYNTLVVYKAKSIENVLYKYCKKWCEYNKEEKQILIVTYTSWPEFILPIIRLKKEYPNITLSSIITDLIDDAMNFEGNRSFLKQKQIAIQFKTIHKIYKHIDKFILLSKAMEEKIPEAKNKNIVVEGIFVPPKDITNIKIQTSTEKILCYTGSLQNFVGINDLVDAFMKTNNPNYRLIICGSGESAAYVKEKSIDDSRIIFKGMISRQEALFIQYRSTALINPRKPNAEITKYSFPSKTMEYLASGTPMIGYRLEGIPDEYFEYMYLPEDLSVKALSKTIDEVLSLDADILKSKSALAKNFILKEKNSIKQVKKILTFLTNIH